MHRQFKRAPTNFHVNWILLFFFFSFSSFVRSCFYFSLQSSPKPCGKFFRIRSSFVFSNILCFFFYSSLRCHQMIINCRIYVFQMEKMICSLFVHFRFMRSRRSRHLALQIIIIVRASGFVFRSFAFKSKDIKNRVFVMAFVV